MSAPIHPEKRKMIVNLVKQHILTQEEISWVAETSLSTVKNIWKLYRETGSIEPKPHRGGNPGWFLNSDYPILEQLVKNDNDATLAELARAFEAKTGELPAISTLYDALVKLNITRKKKRERLSKEIDRM